MERYRGPQHLPLFSIMIKKYKDVILSLVLVFKTTKKKGDLLKTVLKARKNLERIKDIEKRLYEKELTAVKKVFLLYPKCRKKSRLEAWTFIQNKYYVRPYSCNGGDYWVNEKTKMCYIKCPECAETLRIYDHPEINKIVTLVGKETYKVDKIFCIIAVNY